ncbi:hypothetical protein BHE74_00059739 [Ensete ventricosum]|nr:hypothetical protein BHE74_00059739 [Ensete ventricosum]
MAHFDSVVTRPISLFRKPDESGRLWCLPRSSILLKAKAERSIDCVVRGGRMAESADEGGARDPALGADGNPRRSPQASTYKGKSCKGCLYYSSRLKSNARNPVCVGISRTLPQGSYASSCACNDCDLRVTTVDFCLLIL